MSIVETAKGLGGFVIGLIGLVLVVVIAALLLYGVVWVADWLKTLFWVLAKLALSVQILVLIPMSAFRRTRGVSLAGMSIASVVYLILVFVASTVLAYQNFGIMGLVLGLMGAGVGVIAVGIVSALINGMWVEAADVAIVLVIWVGTSLYSDWLEQRQ